MREDGLDEEIFENGFSIDFYITGISFNTDSGNGE